MMKAVKAPIPGGPENLQILSVPIPTPSDHEILVEVHSAALNRADLLERRGLYPPPPGTQGILGLEAAGRVASVGSLVTRWKPGDRVIALLAGGGYAEYLKVNEDHVLVVPESLSWDQAAAIPESWLTGYQLLRLVAQAKEGELALVHAGSSGVGTAVTQMAHQMGLKTVVTAGSQEKLEICRQYKADYLVNYNTEDFTARVAEITGGKGVNLVLDCIGGSYWEKNIQSLGIDGRWVLYATMGGAEVNGPILGKLLEKRIQLLPTNLKARSHAYKAELIRDFSDHALPLFAAGTYRPVVDSVFPLDQVVDAHKMMEANQNKGKIILKVKN